jgi:hypothetical protein
MAACVSVWWSRLVRRRRRWALLLHVLRLHMRVPTAANTQVRHHASQLRGVVCTARRHGRPWVPHRRRLLRLRGACLLKAVALQQPQQGAPAVSRRHVSQLGGKCADDACCTTCDVSARAALSAKDFSCHPTWLRRRPDGARSTPRVPHPWSTVRVSVARDTCDWGSGAQKGKARQRQCFRCESRRFAPHQEALQRHAHRTWMWLRPGIGARRGAPHRQRRRQVWQRVGRLVLQRRLAPPGPRSRRPIARNRPSLHVAALLRAWRSLTQLWRGWRVAEEGCEHIQQRRGGHSRPHGNRVFR